MTASCPACGSIDIRTVRRGARRPDSTCRSCGHAGTADRFEAHLGGRDFDRLPARLGRVHAAPTLDQLDNWGLWE